VSFDFAYVPEEIHLESAPLIRVLAQVRYSSMPELVEESCERQLADVLASDYAVRGQVQGVVFGLPGTTAPAQELYRTFEDTVGHWKVTVAPEFVALETDAYESRSDFVDRWRVVLDALAKVRRPPKVTRIGIRYTDRISDPQGLNELVNPALMGFLPELLNPNDLENQILQSLIKAPDGTSRVQVRSLCLPPNVLFDPTIPAVATPSWVLDIDAFNERPGSFDEGALTDRTRTLAEHAYQVFYWAVTEQFRGKFEGQDGGQSDG
jgi:uncharacterized protein (TIGR04255 family)